MNTALKSVADLGSAWHESIDLQVLSCAAQLFARDMAETVACARLDLGGPVSRCTIVVYEFCVMFGRAPIFFKLVRFAYDCWRNKNIGEGGFCSGVDRETVEKAALVSHGPVKQPEGLW